jgi:hypothetical protein
MDYCEFHESLPIKPAIFRQQIRYKIPSNNGNYRLTPFLKSLKVDRELIFHKLPSEPCLSNPFRGLITNKDDLITHILFTHSYVAPSWATICTPDPSSHSLAPEEGHKLLLPEGATVAKVQVLTYNNTGEAWGIRMFNNRDQLLLEHGKKSFDLAAQKPDEYTVSTRALEEQEIICGLQAYLWREMQGKCFVATGLQFVIRDRASQEESNQTWQVLQHKMRAYH